MFFAALVPLIVGQFASGPDPTVAHAGPISHHRQAAKLFDDDCISPAERAAGLAAIRTYEATQSAGTRAAPLFPFVPMAGTLYADLLPPGYMDENPATNAFRDYTCHNFSYDGHAGTDIGLHSFEEQHIGVPVIAAADGTVVYYHDGEPDESTCLCGLPANALIIDHGANRYGWYWHFRNGSVAAHVGDHVVAGQQLGFAASSGNSAGPHLHFGVALPDGTPIDPFAGNCGPSDSLWVTQPDMDLHSYVADFGYMVEEPWHYPGYPYRFPNTGQMGVDQYLWFWMQLVNLPPNSNWRQRYYRPDNTLAFDSGNVDFGNPTFDRVSNYWFYHYYLWEMREITGTWKIRFDVNGTEVITAPVEVVAVANPNFNRPPVPVAAAFDPPSPTADEVIFCRLSGSLALDDPDYDLVRYEYVWKVNGAEVRRRTIAGRADAFARNSFQPGDTVACTITPSDGHLSATPTTVSIQIAGAGCAPDFDGDGFLTGVDFDLFVQAFENGDQAADFDEDGFITGVDFDVFVAAYESGC